MNYRLVLEELDNRGNPIKQKILEPVIYNRLVEYALLNDYGLLLELSPYDKYDLCPSYIYESAWRMLLDLRLKGCNLSELFDSNLRADEWLMPLFDEIKRNYNVYAVRAFARSVSLSLRDGNKPINFLLWFNRIQERWSGLLTYNEEDIRKSFEKKCNKLGYEIVSSQRKFPDLLVKDSKGVTLRVELEFRSSNFLKHKHKIDECDLIICGINDWVDCPIPVIEIDI